MNKLAVTVYVGVVVIGMAAYVAEARPVYARNENKSCGFCHVRADGGGERGFRGQFYGANGLSFSGFSEKREATIAGLIEGAEGRSTIPAISYNGNVTGPATQQIQLASLRGPVILLFLGKADEASKSAVKGVAALAKAYGPRVTVLGVTRVDAPSALKLTEDLGSLIRIYPDPDGAAIKKFSAIQALDVAVVAKIGDPLKTFEGFSRSSIKGVMETLSTSQQIQAPSFALEALPDKVLRGPKL